MSSLRFLSNSLLYLLFLSLGCSVVAAQSSTAQSSAVAPRITAPVDETKLSKLAGNVPRLARIAADEGEAGSSMQLTHVRLVLSRSAAQQAALDAYMSEQLSKSSANYHKWLTPSQFGSLYGPADSDIAAIVAWAESHGLKLEQVSTGRTNIAFSGTVGQFEEAFHTQIHSFTATRRGKAIQFYSNTSDPSIPAALASVVSGVAHLDTIAPLPQNIAGPSGFRDPATKRLKPVSSVEAKGLRPNLTSGSGTTKDPYFLYIVPGDAATIYDTPNTTFNANYTTGTSYTGSGINIGVGGDATIQATTVEAYRSNFLGDSSAPVIKNVDGVTSTDDTDEAYIDTELSGGLAPGATIYFYTSKDLTSGIDQAITDNIVDIFSLSFGECELDLTTAENAVLLGYWQQAASQGITVTVSAGDNGSAGCDATTDSNGNNITEAEDGLAVSGFASTIYNIAVGGTDLNGLNSSYSEYASTSSGDSATYYRTALSYIPESTWNDSTETDTTISANIPWTAVSGDSKDANIVAGSGGKSSCSTNTSTDNATGTCTSGYVKPFWQTGTGVPADSVRDIPDVSFMAGNGVDPATWLVCTDDTGQNSSGVTVTADCETQSDGYFYFAGFGGTSTASPAFAGMLALVEQKVGGRLGTDANATLYALFNGSHASSIFHDTTVGNNSVPCASGTSDCTDNSAGYYYESGYDTTAGYDLATGLGSIDINELLTYWSSAIGTDTATVTVTPSATTIASSASFTVTVVVSGSDGTPTGNVTLASGSYTTTAEAFSGGTYTFTVAAGALAVGAHTLTVTYGGSSTYAIATGTASVTIMAPVATLSPTSLTFGSTLVGSSAATQTVTLKNSGNATLTLAGTSLTGADATSFSTSTTCLTTLAAGDSCSYIVTFTPAAAGTLTAKLSISDNDSSSPQTVGLTGTGAEVGTYSLSATAVTIATAGSSGTSTVTATAAGGYTGTITLTCSVAAITGGIDTPTCSGSTITVATGATTATGTITLGTTAASSSYRPASLKADSTGTQWKPWIGFGGASLACGLLLAIPARRRAWKSLLGLAAFAAVLGTLSGCGGGGSGTTKTVSGTTAGSYTVTVTGTDTNSVTQTTTFTLTVQ